MISLAELVDRHLLALRNALALARVLNRELILPRLHCMCERSQSPRDILPACVKNGATTDIPFLCPAEQFLNIEEFEGLWTSGYVVVRPWTILNASFHPVASSFFAKKTNTRVRWGGKLLNETISEALVRAD